MKLDKSKFSAKKWLLFFVLFCIGAGIFIYGKIQNDKQISQEEFEDFLRNQMIWELHSRYTCAIRTNGEYYESQLIGVIYTNETLTWWVRCYNSRNATNYQDVQLKTDVIRNVERMQKIYTQLNITELPKYNFDYIPE